MNKTRNGSRPLNRLLMNLNVIYKIHLSIHSHHMKYRIINKDTYILQKTLEYFAIAAMSSFHPSSFPETTGGLAMWLIINFVLKYNDKSIKYIHSKTCAYSHCPLAKICLWHYFLINSNYSDMLYPCPTGSNSILAFAISADHDPPAHPCSLNITCTVLYLLSIVSVTTPIHFIIGF